MINSNKKDKLVLADRTRNKVNFQPNLPHVNKLNLNRPVQLSADIRKRRATFHEKSGQKWHRKTYKFSQTVKKAKKTTRYKNLWISKRGTRNFYIMQNQDYVLIDQKNKDYRFYAILDGHGKYGKFIAENVANKLPIKYSIDQKQISKENPQRTNQKIMKNAIEETNKDMNMTFPKQTNNSGCTFLSVIIRDNRIFCFNVGSSRAILAYKSQLEGNLLSMPLSTDQNLSRFDQKFRILQTKAVLQELKDQNGCRIGPQRIWKKGQKYPGLYITRSLGMRLSQQLGIISVPEITNINIQKGFEFILACSDGFWQVFENNDAIQYLSVYWKQQNLQEGIDNLLDQAVRRWDKKSELMDDISILIIRF